jgi:hypothetical protein
LKSSSPPSPGDRLVVGWREWVGLPDLGIDAIKVKVDTGARTSSLHAERVRIERDAEGQRWARFIVHPTQRSRVPEVETRALLLDERLIRSSNGAIERRPVIRTTVIVGSHRWTVEVTLARRDLMGFRMLLGRTAIRGHAVVDPGASYVTRRLKKRKRSPGATERPSGQSG